jgi:hypothetical protein
VTSSHITQIRSRLIRDGLQRKKRASIRKLWNGSSVLSPRQGPEIPRDVVSSESDVDTMAQRWLDSFGDSLRSELLRHSDIDKQPDQIGQAEIRGFFLPITVEKLR